MKKTLIPSALALTLLIAGAASARPPLPADAMAPVSGPDAQVARLTERLSLTPEQQTEIRAILEADRTERATQRAALRERIDAVLTDAQRAERDAQMRQRIERRVARMADRLDLSAEQGSKLTALMIEKRDNPAWTRADTRERLSAILTEGQLARLDALYPGDGPRSRGGCRR